LASQDIEKFYEDKPNDPYRIIWRYLINAKLDEKVALANLKLHSQPEKEDYFIWRVIDLFAGRIGEGDLLQLSGVGVTSNREHAERLTEMYFYLGYWHREQGNIDKAIHYYQLTTATAIHDFIEYKYAYMELSSIQDQLMQEHEKKLAAQRKEVDEKGTDKKEAQ
jgi:lipoprotein NlpI